MNHLVIVERVESDGLRKTEYRYRMREDLKVELDRTMHFERPTKRHGWRVIKFWSRLSICRDNTMEREEPPQDVKDEIRRKINDALQFC